MIDLNGSSKKSLEIAEKRMNNGARIDTDTRKMLKHAATEVVEATEAYCQREFLGAEAVYDKSRFASELADIICCVLIMAGREGIDIERAVHACMEKNERRADGEGDKL